MGLRDLPRSAPRPGRVPSQARPAPGRAVPAPHLLQALGWGASNDGALTGLPPQTAGELRRHGLAEAHPTRLSHMGRPGSAGYGALHRSLRMTAKGFEAVGLPHRAGRAWFVFRGDTIVPGRGVQLLVRGGLLQTSMSELVAARRPRAVYDHKGIPIPVPERIPDPTTFESHETPEEAFDAVERLAGRAAALSGAEGAMLDPAHLSWDGISVGMEDMGPEGDRFEPLSFDEAFARLREPFQGAVPGFR